MIISLGWEKSGHIKSGFYYDKTVGFIGYMIMIDDRCKVYNHAYIDYKGILTSVTTFQKNCLKETEVKQVSKIFDQIEVIECMFQHWEECVDYIGDIFISNKWTNTSYFECVKKDLIENDAYMVLAPHIVLLHTACENGALENRFYLGKLNHAVNFLHAQNDPVEVVLAFSATSSEAHMRSIQRLAYRMMDKMFLSCILSAHNTEELERIIAMFEEGKENE